MKFPLFLFSLSLLPGSLCPAQTVSGVSHTRVHQQVGVNQTLQERFVFRAFVEGSLTANSPFSSVSVSKSLSFENGRWAFEDDLVGVTQAQYSNTYPNGTYTMNGSGDTASVSLTSAYPNQPVVTFDNGSWQGGELILTAEQAKSEFSLNTNQSNGDGFVSLEIVDLDSDEDIANIVENTEGTSIFHTVPANSLKPGHR